MKDIAPSEPGPALAEAINLRLRPGSPLEVGSWSARGTTLACIGSATALLDALVDARHIDGGVLLLAGQPASALLASGEAAYVPRSLPLPSGTRVDRALSLSAQLLGLGSVQVDRALDRCLLTPIRKKRLGQLSCVEMRLLCLAHGICSSPGYLLLEDLLGDLDDAEAEVLSSVLDLELPNRRHIFAASLESAASRRLVMGADHVLVGDGDKLGAPKSPRELVSGGFWVTCSADASDFAKRLRIEGADVTLSPSPQVLLVAGKTGHQIYREAVRSGVIIVELLPHPGEGFAETRARSGA